MITRAHHIALIVSSEHSLDFYRLLGFTETYRKVRKYDTAVLMEGYGMQLEIFVDDRHPGRGDVEPTGLRHFALKTDLTLEEEMERLSSVFRENGAQIEFGPIMNDWTGVRFCFTRDLDGMAIELRE